MLPQLLDAILSHKLNQNVDAMVLMQVLMEPQEQVMVSEEPLLLVPDLDNQEPEVLTDLESFHPSLLTLRLPSVPVNSPSQTRTS